MIQLRKCVYLNGVVDFIYAHHTPYYMILIVDNDWQVFRSIELTLSQVLAQHSTEPIKSRNWILLKTNRIVAAQCHMIPNFCSHQYRLAPAPPPPFTTLFRFLLGHTLSIYLLCTHTLVLVHNNNSPPCTYLMLSMLIMKRTKYWWLDITGHDMLQMYPCACACVCVCCFRWLAFVAGSNSMENTLWLMFHLMKTYSLKTAGFANFETGENERQRQSESWHNDGRRLRRRWMLLIKLFDSFTHT